MELTVTLIGKDIQKDKQKFTSFSGLTAKGNWYRITNMEEKDLKPHRDNIVVLEVIRKFDKEVLNNRTGEYVGMPSLVVVSVREPNEQELKEYNAIKVETDAATLEGIE